MFKLLFGLYKLYEIGLWMMYIAIVLFIMLSSVTYLSMIYVFLPKLIIAFIIGIHFNKEFSGFINSTLIMLPISFSKQYFALLLGKLAVYTLFAGTYWLLSLLVVSHYSPVAEKVFAEILFNIKIALTTILAFGIGMDLSKYFNFKRKAFNELLAQFITLVLLIIGIFSFLLNTYLLYPESSAMSSYNSIDVFFILYLPILITIGLWAFKARRNKFGKNK